MNYKQPDSSFSNFAIATSGMNGNLASTDLLNFLKDVFSRAEIDYTLSQSKHVSSSQHLDYLGGYLQRPNEILTKYSVQIYNWIQSKVNLGFRIHHEGEGQGDYLIFLRDINQQIKGYPHYPHSYMLEKNIHSATIIS